MHVLKEISANICKYAKKVKLRKMTNCVSIYQLHEAIQKIVKAESQLNVKSENPGRF